MGKNIPHLLIIISLFTSFWWLGDNRFERSLGIQYSNFEMEIDSL